MAKYTREMFILDKFDNNEFITREWDIVASSAIFKEEYRKDEAEKEVVLSYANALNCIAASILNQNHSSAAFIEFRVDSLTIPFIFIARHTVELALKYMCRLLDIECLNRHSLMSLWDKILKRLAEFESIQDGDMDDIKTFISVMEELDCDGSHARYSKNNKGELYNVRPKFVNFVNINNFIQNFFVKLINSIKIEKK